MDDWLYAVAPVLDIGGASKLLHSCVQAACAAAAVSGLQGDSGSGPNSYLTAGHIVAEAKHFGAYGGSSKDGAPVEVGMGALHDIYLRPWKAAAKAGLRALMASHNDINGRPCHSNPFLLTKVMREEFGFGDGLVNIPALALSRVVWDTLLRTESPNRAVGAWCMCRSPVMATTSTVRTPRSSVATVR
jgi:beta-glucosidase-like glycosyl hydrolase